MKLVVHDPKSMRFKFLNKGYDDDDDDDDDDVENRGGNVDERP